MPLPRGLPILKAVVPAAGLGTRLLSATKEQPKEMLPIFARANHDYVCLKPMLQEIFERLFDYGVRDFYFVVGRGKRAIEDHFTPDRDFVRRLNSQGKNGPAIYLERFYKKIEASTIVWVNQPEPRGFGDAVLQAKSLVGDHLFLVHAGDTYIYSKYSKGDIYVRLSRAFTRGEAEAAIILKEVKNPRHYGVAEVFQLGSRTRVRRVIEKPKHPASNLAIMPIYVFSPSIFEALKSTPPGTGGEIQLTDGIQNLIDQGRQVGALKLSNEDIRLDIGTPETYWEALQISFKEASRKGTRRRS
jgi:UTP--glucose-1-phosphate uridylyltransferase